MRVRVHVASEAEDGICSVVVVHDLNCPFVYEELDSFRRMHWQTMLKVAVLDIDVGSNGYKNGFYVVISNCRLGQRFPFQLIYVLGCFS